MPFPRMCSVLAVLLTVGCANATFNPKSLLQSATRKLRGSAQRGGFNNFHPFIHAQSGGINNLQHRATNPAGVSFFKSPFQSPFQMRLQTPGANVFTQFAARGYANRQGDVVRDPSPNYKNMAQNYIAEHKGTDEFLEFHDIDMTSFEDDMNMALINVAEILKAEMGDNTDIKPMIRWAKASWTSKAVPFILLRLDPEELGEEFMNNLRTDAGYSGVGAEELFSLEFLQHTGIRVHPISRAQNIKGDVVGLGIFLHNEGQVDDVLTRVTANGSGKGGIVDFAEKLKVKYSQPRGPMATLRHMLQY